MATLPPPSSADDSHNKQQLTERSEESEYETISQDESLGSPTVAPYNVDDDFSFSSPRPVKRTRSHHQMPATIRDAQQPESTSSSAPSSKEHSQEQVAHKDDTSHRSGEAAAGPSNESTDTFPSTPPTQPKDGNHQDNQQGCSTSPKSSSLSQPSTLPDNQQAAMSPHTRANLSQQTHFREESASDQQQQQQQQPVSSLTSDNVNPQQQQQRQEQHPEEGGHHHHVHIRVFFLQRRPPE
ncbi:hypothetical protein MBANPS3_008736 [Mucor bainieri]